MEAMYIMLYIMDYGRYDEHRFWPTRIRANSRRRTATVDVVTFRAVV